MERENQPDSYTDTDSNNGPCRGSLDSVLRRATNQVELVEIRVSQRVVGKRELAINCTVEQQFASATKHTPSVDYPTP